MNLATFIDQRRPEWKKLEELLEVVEGSGLRVLDEGQAVEFGRLYRRAASDLNQAQTYLAGDTTVQYLNTLVGRCYLVIHTGESIYPGSRLLWFFRNYPVVFRRHAGSLVLATLILTAGALFGFVASFYDAEVARSFLLPSDFPMIQPGQRGQVLSSGELAAFSSFLFRNNVQVALLAFALGLTFGIGTVWVLFHNGVILGALAAVFVEAGALEEFATGVLPHGVLEIPAILLGGAAGLVLSQALIHARPWPRLEELTRVGKRALLLVAGCFPLLAAAAILEAVVARAPDWYLDSGFKLAVAGLFALLFAAYVLLLGRKARPSPATIETGIAR